jgi:hypothetical protein
MTLARTRKALIVAALLAGIFSCWSSEIPTKFMDIYLVIPAMVLLIIVSPENNVLPRTRYTLLILSLFLLVPNDICGNPMNWWWINKVGASPLTYACPVNVLLLLTMKKANRAVAGIVSVLVVLYYLGALYHRLRGY